MESPFGKEQNSVLCVESPGHQVPGLLVRRGTPYELSGARPGLAQTGPKQGR